MVEMEGSHMEGEDMEDGYGEGEDEEPEYDYMNDPAFEGLEPLDKLRKSRRNILNSINELRQSKNVPVVTPEHLRIWVANDYAEHVLQSGPDEEILKEIMEKHDAVSATGHKYVCIIGEAFYDAESGDDKELAEALWDAHGLLFELKEESKIIQDKEHTHVAIGFAYS